MRTIRQYISQQNLGRWHEKTQTFWQKAQKAVYVFSVYGYACLYMFTGVGKLINIESFTKGLHKTPYIQQHASLMGLCVPLLEILLALMLIIPGRIQRIALWASTLLMLAFTIFIAWMMKYHPNQLCHCGKAIEKMGWHTHLVFNLIWLALGACAIRYHNKFINKTKLS